MDEVTTGANVLAINEMTNSPTKTSLRMASQTILTQRTQCLCLVHFSSKYVWVHIDNVSLWFHIIKTISVDNRLKYMQIV